MEMKIKVKIFKARDEKKLDLKLSVMCEEKTKIFTQN